MIKKKFVSHTVNSNYCLDDNENWICVYIHLKSTKCVFCSTLFPNCKAVSQRQEGLRKTYVINPGYFEFGPLLCGKTRDRWEAVNHLVNVYTCLHIYRFTSVCVHCPGSRKLSTRKTQRNSLSITIQAWRLRSISSSSKIPRLQHILWTRRQWLSNLMRNRCHHRVYKILTHS